MRRRPMLVLLLALSAGCVVGACSGASTPADLFGDAPLGERATEAAEPVGSEPIDVEAGGNVDAARDAEIKRPDASEAGRDGGDGGRDGGDGGRDGGPGPRCDDDLDCAVGLCNWKTDRCAPAGPLNAPCKRDIECTASLCNWKLETCLAKVPSGSPCRRNTECKSGFCTSADTCG